MKYVHMAAFILLVVGGLNWLLWGAFQWEIGMLFGGSTAIVSRIIYVLVGAAAVYEIFTHRRDCKNCSSVATSSAVDDSSYSYSDM